jgi:Rieske Fe-S protein
MGRIHKLYRISRRTVIKSIFLILSILLIYKILDVKAVRQKNRITVKLDSVPVGGGIVLRKERVAIIRQSNNIAIYSLICPHLGCTINLTEKLFKCPCHGSEFDLNGNIIKGPANKNLNTLSYEIKGETIIIYT